MARPQTRTQRRPRNFGALKAKDDPQERPPARRMEDAQPEGTSALVRYVAPDPAQVRLPVREAGTGGKPARKLEWRLTAKSKRTLAKVGVGVGSAAVGATAGFALGGGFGGNGGPAGTGSGEGNPTDNQAEQDRSDGFLTLGNTLGSGVAGLAAGTLAGLLEGMGFEPEDAQALAELLLIAAAIFLVYLIFRKNDG